MAIVAGDESWAGEEPHPAPARQYMVSLQGAVEVTASDGDTRRVGPGEVLLIEDTTGKGHSTRAIGEIKFLIIRAA
jgi:quercetin dioxygenase-like cupin family protein